MVVETKHTTPTTVRHHLLTFEVAGQQYAIHSRYIEQIAAMAELQRPTAAPDMLIGFLSGGGA